MHHAVGPNTDRAEQRGYQTYERRLADPAKTKARKGDAQLGGGQIRVEVLDGALNGDRAAYPLAYELLDAGATRLGTSASVVLMRAAQGEGGRGS